MHLINTGDHFLVYNFRGEHFYAVQDNEDEVRKWVDECARIGQIIKIPNRFPLSDRDLHYFPNVKSGRNVLSTLYMILREQVNSFHP